MNILYTFLNFNSFTGSELYYYELAKEMVRLGHKVTIASSCGGEIRQKAFSHGISCVDFEKIKSFNYDIIHASHQPVVDGLLKHKLKCPLVVTCHSELLHVEQIPNSDKISHFIGIRPDIYNSLPAGKKSLIYNPVDVSRFNKEDLSDSGIVFFPGTINYLRAQPLIDLTLNYGKDYTVVSMGSNDYPDSKLKGVVYMKPSFNCEELIKKSTFVAGIIRGRTYIEAALCGKSYIDYKVDGKGNIVDIEVLNPKDTLNMQGVEVEKEKFDSKNVAIEIELLYKSLV